MGNGLSFHPIVLRAFFFLNCPIKHNDEMTEWLRGRKEQRKEQKRNKGRGTDKVGGGSNDEDDGDEEDEEDDYGDYSEELCPKYFGNQYEEFL